MLAGAALTCLALVCSLRKEWPVPKWHVQQASQWEGCSSVACGEARKFHNECDGDAACFEGKVCSDSRVCATWKSANCGGARQLFAAGGVTKMRAGRRSVGCLGSPPLVLHCL